jgi:hypothetical protein
MMYGEREKRDGDGNPYKRQGMSWRSDLRPKFKIAGNK